MADSGENFETPLFQFALAMISAAQQLLPFSIEIFRVMKDILDNSVNPWTGRFLDKVE